ncbi:hypothetical protein [Streptomyces virginiae]|uniref:hypothetical protein n=1 Tax=Streptomyces virginiae TaxID=1961 RepID=UPI0036B10C6D
MALSCVVAYVVYRRTQSHQHTSLTGRPGRGDMVAALTAGAAFAANVPIRHLLHTGPEFAESALLLGVEAVPVPAL